MQTDYKYNMGNLSYPDIQDYLKKKDIVMVPIASLEQHSYHCPLFTDMITAREVVYRAAQQAERAKLEIRNRVRELRDTNGAWWSPWRVLWGLRGWGWAP